MRRKGERKGPATRECRELQEMKNSGNEAKKYLKTKHITFLGGANYARFVHELAQISACKEQKQHNLRKRAEASESKGKARQVT